jgi:hypothetical protein
MLLLLYRPVPHQSFMLYSEDPAMKLSLIIPAAILIIVSTAMSMQRASVPTAAAATESTTQVTGYYRPVMAHTAHWNEMSLKLKVTRSGNGETYRVAAYKLPFDFGWKELYVGPNAAPVQGSLSAKYSHSVVVAGYTVYFSLC